MTMTRVKIFALRIAFGAVLASVPAMVAAQSSPADTVRGTVTDSSGRPLRGLTVAATGAGTAKSTMDTTDAAGAYRIVIQASYESYLVSVIANGTVVHRAIVQPRGTTRVFESSIVIASSALIPTLPSVAVQSHARAHWEQVTTPGELTSSLTRQIDELPPLIPNARQTPNGGYAFAGMDPSQTQLTYEGIPLPNMPLATWSMAPTITSAPFDVARGGFSGGALRYQLYYGGTIRSIELSGVAPVGPTPDGLGSSVSSAPTTRTISYTSDGVIGKHEDVRHGGSNYYAANLSASSTTSGIASILDTRSAGLRNIGVSRDSVERFIGTVNGTGLPLVSGRARDYQSDQLQLTARFQHDANSTGEDGSGAGLVVITTKGRNVSPGDPLALPSAQGRSASSVMGLTARHAWSPGYKHVDIGGALSRVVQESEAYLDAPGGTVLIASDSAGELGGSTLRFGGADMPFARTVGTRAELHHVLSWVSFDASHSFEMGQQVELHDSRVLSRSGSGTFTFNSLAELAAQRPASFTRLLDDESRSASTVIASTYLKNRWRANDRVTLNGGLRMDATSYPTKRARNAAVEAAFGRRTDAVPNELHVTPAGGVTIRYPDLGHLHSGTIIVGLGVLQGNPSPTTVLSVFNSTGLPTGARLLSCVGSATPTPNWSGYLARTMSLPTQCANGTGSPALALDAPGVTLFQRGYSTPARTAASIAWDSRFPIVGGVSVVANLSRGKHISSYSDLNFRPEAQLTLPSEGDRSVFASLQAIDAATGAVSSASSRRIATYSQVMERRSDLHNTNRSFTVTLSPRKVKLLSRVKARYKYVTTTEEFRGFDDAAAGDPSVIERSESAQPRHEATVNVRLLGNRDPFGLWLSGGARSGSAFTPRVSADVNGDGFANDRAFVFDPATAPYPLAGSMRTLIDGAPKRARDCLLRQLGRIAGRNSCRGPGSASIELAGVYLPPASSAVPFRVTLSTQNLLGGLDMAMHGASKLRGWGDVQYVDPVLLQPTGFDASSRAFRYQVNQHFGRPVVGAEGYHVPFQLSLLVSVHLGPSPTKQIAEQILGQLRTAKMEQSRSVDSVAATLERSEMWNYSNIAALIIAARDSIALTRTQLAAVAQVAARSQALLHVAALAKARLLLDPELTRDPAALGRRLAKVDEELDPKMRATTAPLLEILSDDQIEGLPASIIWAVKSDLGLF